MNVSQAEPRIAHRAAILVMAAATISGCDRSPLPSEVEFRATAPIPAYSVVADGTTITDLGALQPGGFASAWAINDHGYVVGSSGPFPTYCCGWITGQSHAFLWDPTTASMRDLGVPMHLYGGGINSSAFAINDDGWIAGSTRQAYWEVGTQLFTSVAGAVLDAPAWDPFDATTHTMTVRGSIAYQTQTIPQDINAARTIVGVAELSPSQAFVWTEADGISTLPGLVSGGGSGAHGINDAGQIVGWSAVGATVHPVRWDAATRAVEDLGLPSGWRQGVARDVNQSGQIVGYGVGADGEERGFVWDPTTRSFTIIGTLGGLGSRAYGVNSEGKVVGSSRTATAQMHAFAWDSRTNQMLDLGVLPGDSESEARAINDRDQAVGRSGDRAVRWDVSFVTAIAIDIKPGNAENSVARKAKGVVPVAILSTQKSKGEITDFDAMTVDVSTVRFGPGGAVEIHGKGHTEDVDFDGDTDMVLHFDVQAANLPDGATEACVTGRAGARQIRGCDHVRLVN